MVHDCCSMIARVVSGPVRQESRERHVDLRYPPIGKGACFKDSGKLMTRDTRVLE